MDFAKLNTRADAERGAWLHFTHPQLGHALYTGPGADEHGRLVNPELDHVKAEAKIKGVESEVVRAKLRTLQGARKQDEADDDKFVASLVVELRGVTSGDRALTAAEADVLWLFGRSQAFKGQVLQFALEPSNFFGAASV